MGGRFDAMMMQAQAQQQAQGSYSGTAVPNVAGYSPHGYTRRPTGPTRRSRVPT